jgi:hypothetical protein
MQDPDFNTDPLSINSDHYKSLIKGDIALNSISDDDLIIKDEAEEILDAEIVERPLPEVANKIEFLHKHTFDGFPDIPEELIERTKNLRNRGSSESVAIVGAFESFFSELNTTYGLKVRLDINSFAKSLEYLIDPRNKEAMSLYLSEAFGRFRIILYYQYLTSIVQLSSQILDPNYIGSQSIPIQDRFIMVEKLYDFMDKLETLNSRVHIPDSELKLRNVSASNEDSIDTNSNKVQDFLENFRKSIVEKNSEQDSDM